MHSTGSNSATDCSLLPGVHPGCCWWWCWYRCSTGSGSTSWGPSSLQRHVICGYCRWSRAITDRQGRRRGRQWRRVVPLFSLLLFLYFLCCTIGKHSGRRLCCCPREGGVYRRLSINSGVHVCAPWGRQHTSVSTVVVCGKLACKGLIAWVTLGQAVQEV